jgi:hypothetical protein
VARDQRHLLNREPSLEKSARTFMTQIVEIKVVNFQLNTPAPECRAYRSAIEGKNSGIFIVSTRPLFFDDRPCIVTRRR